MCNHRETKFRLKLLSILALLSIKSAACIGVVFSLLLLSSCSHLLQAPYFDTYDWQAEGKLAVQASKFDGGKNQSLSYRWRQRDSSSFIEFISPLGQRLFYIEKYSEHVVLRAASGQELTAKSLSDLALMQMGVNLPLDNLVSFMFEESSAEALAGLKGTDWSVDQVSYIDGHLHKLVLINASVTKLIILVKEFEQAH